MSSPTRVTVAYGDGIGPEIMKATIKVLTAAGAQLEYDEIKIGEAMYTSGHTSGISPESWDLLRQNDVFLKAPITTPQGGGYKSLNVTIRKSMGLYANVRPVRAYTPFVQSNFPKMDVVVVRENEEDLYAGIEHQQTPEVVQCLKLVSKPGCEKICRYAFEYARANGRKKVTCMSKDNIMKHTDGLFHSVFNEVAKEYSDIESDHYIIDIGSAKIADDPERFDVIVTLNLYGDIISDITAEIAGSVGLGGSSNIGDSLAMFEAIHGSAPDIAGQGIANPSGLINGACLMLSHIGQAGIAEKIQNALLKTLEDGIHTGDLASDEFTKQRANTQEFADAVIARFGQKPSNLQAVSLNKDAKPIKITIDPTPLAKKELKGCDVFLDWSDKDRDPDFIGDELVRIAKISSNMKLKMITNRGVKVYPGGMPETFCTDHWRCRFLATDGKSDVSYTQLTALLNDLITEGYNFIKTENLYVIDGKRAYSLGQGE